jgi:hypothetical protein
VFNLSSTATGKLSLFYAFFSLPVPGAGYKPLILELQVKYSSTPVMIFVLFSLLSSQAAGFKLYILELLGECFTTLLLLLAN